MSNAVQKFSRREVVTQAGLLLGATVVGGLQAAEAAESRTRVARKYGGFRFCLNSATIRGEKMGIVKEIEIAAKAGYQAIEPWVASIETYKKEGGSLPELKRRISDLGLTMEDAIAFPQWLVDDDARRAQALEQAKISMDLIAQVGGKRMAAPPAGATDLSRFDLLTAAERYRALLEIGDQTGVVPQLELWGFSKRLNQLGECVAVAIETQHPKACVLGDVYHLYKGGSGWVGLRLLSKNAIQVLHMNDYPAEPPRETIDDSYRVYPGDGVAPLTEILSTLHSVGAETVLSLELFNRIYWAMDPSENARTGLEKMKAVVNKALGR